MAKKPEPINGTIEQVCRLMVIKQLKVDASKITLEASFVDDLGADSLDRVELLFAFEERFDLNIPDEEAEGLLTTFGKMVDYVCQQIGKQPTDQAPTPSE